MEQNMTGGGGVSTELTLLYNPYNIENNPYKIKKKLAKSDIGPPSWACRLLIPQLDFDSHLRDCMSDELLMRVKTTEGAEVAVWDADTCSEHRLTFAFWASYVLKGGWIRKFVRRRRLSKGDEIGIYWDTIASRFLFSLLRRAN